MAKKKKRKRKRGKKDGKLKKNKGKEKKKRVIFTLDSEDVSPKKVIDSVIEKLKEVRGKLKKQHLEELIFARDILTVISEVVDRYDRALESGRFSSSPVATYLYRTLNYMLAAYQNIEKMLIEKPFDFLDEYYDKRFTSTDTGVKKVTELKHGRHGKQHMPLVSKERKKRSKKKEVKKKKFKKNKRGK